ncbi:MAG: hypothetical protein ACQEXJ_23465 [Myxococcota bacterium]
MRRGLLIAAIALALAGASPRIARGAACCMSATATGVGRLLIWETFAVGATTSWGTGIGRWDRDRRWSSYGDGYTDDEWRSEVWTLVRLSRRTSLGARLPFLLTHREAGGTSDVGGGLADVQALVRYEVLSVGEYAELPAVALTAGVVAPTGRATEDSDSPLGADVTGRGAAALTLGLSVERTRMPWFVRGDVGLTVPLPAHRDDIDATQRYGVGLDGSVTGGFEVTEDVVTSLVLRAGWEAPVHIDGERVEDSARYDTGASLAASWRMAPHWTLQGSVGTGLPFRHLGVNREARVTTSLGLRYGYF